MDKAKIIAIGIALIIASAAIGIVITNLDDGKNGGDMSDFSSWDEIVKDASGQSVNLGFYMTMDPAINETFLPYMKTQMKELYNITITCDNTGYTGYGPLAAKESVAEIESGRTSNGKYDLIWGDTSAYATMIKNGSNYDYVYSKTTANGRQWGDMLPNGYYLKSNSNDTISSQFSGFVPGTAVNFSNGQTMFVYNGDFNRAVFSLGGVDVRIPHDCVIIYMDGGIGSVVKVGTAGETFADASQASELATQSAQGFHDAWASCTTTYSIDSVRDVMTGDHDGTGAAKGRIAYGVPMTFEELADWVRIYPGQFTYPNYTNASATFHTNLLVQAAMYELTWDGNSGWRTAPDRAANVTAVNLALADVHNEADFKNAFGYAFNYLNDIEPYLHQYSEGSKYIDSGTITAYNSKMVGNGTSDGDYKDGTILLALTTCTSIDSRVIPGSGHGVVGQYGYDAKVFSMSTGCYSDYYMFIPANSSHATAAAVVANWLLDPETQFRFYTQTGNGFNIDTDKQMIGSDGGELGCTVGEYFNDDDHRLYEYTLSLSVDTLRDVTVPSDFTPYASIAANTWKAAVYDSDEDIVKH